jgi:hypothetical protein
MEKYTFQLENQADLVVLSALFHRLNIPFERQSDDSLPPAASKIEHSAEEKMLIAKAELNEIRKKGVDVSAFGDPVVWQRETRKDRPLPFRD